VLPDQGEGVIDGAQAFFLVHAAPDLAQLLRQQTQLGAPVPAASRRFKALVETPGLARGTIYYKHYLFSTYFKFHRADLFFGNLGFWRNCIGWNLSTILETPEINSRSDCHGWGSHPLWHMHTGVAGVKSAAPFYEKVLVEPQPAHLKRIRSTTPTPKGDVKLTRLSVVFHGGNLVLCSEI
jgi:hypothetical protein